MPIKIIPRFDRLKSEEFLECDIDLSQLIFLHSTEKRGYSSLNRARFEFATSGIYWSEKALPFDDTHMD
jgi:hypothetical protein